VIEHESRGEFEHVPVMSERIVALLAPALQSEGAILVDATLGLGGHSGALLRSCPAAQLVGIDRDPGALAVAGERLADLAGRTTFVHAVYDQVGEALADLGIGTVQGVLFDLGVSSMQLDDPDRGFAYSYDAALDMRMDPTSGLTAAEVVNAYPSEELARVLREYGEERFARRIAQQIVQSRPILSSAQLVDVIRAAVPAPAQRTAVGHPAKRTFQALRIEVNDELGALRRALPVAITALAVGGRIVVMSYQSLEDRIVKQALVAHAKDDVPVGLPVAGRGPELKLLTRGAERAADAEIATNPRAASVRVRAAERLRAAA
jgi:16S rRNA (cytosine1402-N4)-methyltransferase